MSSIHGFTDHKSEVIEILQNLTKNLITELKVSFEQEGEQWRIQLETDDNGTLIGHQGENLLALQHILRTLFHAKHPENRTHFVLDIGSYRSSREKYITNLVREIVYTEVLQNGVSIIIKGLNSYERRLIHSNLASYNGVESSSIGTEGNRRMIIRPTMGTNTLGIEEAKVIDIEKYEQQFRQNQNLKNTKID